MVATDSSAMATTVAKKFLEDAALAWLPPIPRLRWRPASACFDIYMPKIGNIEAQKTDM
jgi:hypothetical protein